MMKTIEKGIVVMDIAKIDTFEVRLVWAKCPSWADTSQYLGVDYYINGVSLFDMIREIEKPYFDEEGNPELTGDYGLNSVKVMRKQFARAFKDDEVIDLYCCAECGFSECWSVYCRFEEDGDFIVMKNFEHNFRDLTYPLEFRFAKENFNEEISKLNFLGNEFAK